MKPKGSEHLEQDMVATVEQINKHDDRKKLRPMGNKCSSRTIPRLPQSVLMKNGGKHFSSRQCATNKSQLVGKFGEPKAISQFWGGGLGGGFFWLL